MSVRITDKNHDVDQQTTWKEQTTWKDSWATEPINPYLIHRFCTIFPNHGYRHLVNCAPRVQASTRTYLPQLYSQLPKCHLSVLGTPILSHTPNVFSISSTSHPHSHSTQPNPASELHSSSSYLISHLIHHIISYLISLSLSLSSRSSFSTVSSSHSTFQISPPPYSAQD